MYADLILFLYGAKDMYDGSFSHLTLWTWNLHCLANFYVKYGKNNFFKNVLSHASLSGSFCVLASYLFVLFLNPTLENDLNTSLDTTTMWLRSFLLHVVPCISSYSMFTDNPVSLKYLSFYLAIPLLHLFVGIIFEYFGRRDFDAFEIYVNYESGRSNKYGITKSTFIMTNVFIMLSTILSLSKLKK